MSNRAVFVLVQFIGQAQLNIITSFSLSALKKRGLRLSDGKSSDSKLKMTG